MRIAHILSQNQLTGAEVYAVQLISEQIKNNHSVYQVSNGFFTNTEAEKFQMPVETNGFFEYIKSIFILRKFLIQNKIQVIHSHSRAASKLAKSARLGLKIGFVSSIHGRQHLSISKKIHNVYGDFLIPVCENIDQQLKVEFKYNPRRIKTIANGIDQKLFSFAEKKTGTSETLAIGLIGRDTGPKKIRTEFFVSEFSQILEARRINYHFTIVGGLEKNFDIKNKYVTYYETTGLNSAFYQKFDLICGSGRACIESLLSGVPVIAFGESAYCGLVTEENYLHLKKSNFGDIGFDFHLPTFNPKIAAKDVEQFSTVNLKNLAQLARDDFSLIEVNKKIERLYESSYFLRHYSKWIPILMYHKIPEQDLDSIHKIFVQKEKFEKHLQFFKKMGFTTLTFSELKKYQRGEIHFKYFPRKPLVLTFDDGYTDNLVNADPLLKEYNMKAQIFLLADAQIESNTWDQWSQDSAFQKNERHLITAGENRKKWLTSNFEIGSHGLNHLKMPLMTRSEKKIELTESKKKLESEFEIKICAFAYTYGDTDAECARACEDTGYDYGLNTDTGGLLLEEEPYSVFRVNIFPDENILSLWKKTSKWYRQYYYLKRGR